MKGDYWRLTERVIAYLENKPEDYAEIYCRYYSVLKLFVKIEFENFPIKVWFYPLKQTNPAKNDCDEEGREEEGGEEKAEGIGLEYFNKIVGIVKE